MKYKMLVMDVDGTLTDGKLYIGAQGEMMKAFNVKDGYGIVEYRKRGGIPVIITGRQSRIVEERCKELGITELFQGVEDKLAKLKEIADTYQISKEEIAYIGDDINDMECMHYTGLSACPHDAIQDVRNNVDYVCETDGGNGAVRELIDRYIF